MSRDVSSLRILRARYSRGASMMELPSIWRSDAARMGFFRSMATETRAKCFRSTSELAIVQAMQKREKIKEMGANGWW